MLSLKLAAEVIINPSWNLYWAFFIVKCILPISEAIFGLSTESVDIFSSSGGLSK